MIYKTPKKVLEYIDKHEPKVKNINCDDIAIYLEQYYDATGHHIIVMLANAN